MEMVTLGKTGITVNKNGFGRSQYRGSAQMMQLHLREGHMKPGMTFFDTARFYTDSEEKLGEAFDGMREKSASPQKRLPRMRKTSGKI